jgi:hypothetical protein
MAAGGELALTPAPQCMNTCAPPHRLQEFVSKLISRLTDRVEGRRVCRSPMPGLASP